MRGVSGSTRGRAPKSGFESRRIDLRKKLSDLDRKYTLAVQKDMGFWQGLSIKYIKALNCCPSFFTPGPISKRILKIDERRLATRRQLIELCKTRPV